MCAKDADAGEFTGEVRVEDALNESEGGHAEEEIKRMKFEGTWEGKTATGCGSKGGTCLESVCGNCFEGREESPEEGEEETGKRVVIIAVGGKGDSEDDGEQGDEFSGREWTWTEEKGKGDDKKGSCCTYDLVKRNCDELKGDVRDGDIDGIEDGKGGKEQCFAGDETCWCKVTQFHCKIGTKCACKGMQGSECVRKWESDEDELVVECQRQVEEKVEQQPEWLRVEQRRAGVCQGGLQGRVRRQRTRRWQRRQADIGRTGNDECWREWTLWFVVVIVASLVVVVIMSLSLSSSVVVSTLFVAVVRDRLWRRREHDTRERGN